MFQAILCNNYHASFLNHILALPVQNEETDLKSPLLWGYKVSQKKKVLRIILNHFRFRRVKGDWVICSIEDCQLKKEGSLEEVIFHLLIQSEQIFEEPYIVLVVGSDN
ncbi:uncharacterized protein ACOB8E_019023 isoform 1-T1 [Sarcophilus harrisii]